MSNQPYKARPEIVNANSNNLLFRPFSIKTSKCSGNCHNINDPYARICAPDIVKKFTITFFTINFFTFSIITNTMQNKVH